MSVFAPTTDPNQKAGQTISNSQFWPAISIDEFRATTRLQDTITDGRVQQALTESMLSANRELTAWRDSQLTLGYAELGSVPAERIGEKTALEHHYLSAIYAQAKARLMEQYRDIDTTVDGKHRAAEFEGTIESWRRTARESIRALLGAQRATIELI